MQTATNNGNVAETINIQGANTTNWTLAATAGVDQYVHQFSINSGTVWTALTTSYSTLTVGLAALGTQTFDLKITTPSSTTFFTTQSPNVTLQAVAS